MPCISSAAFSCDLMTMYPAKVNTHAQSVIMAKKSLSAYIIDTGTILFIPSSGYNFSDRQTTAPSPFSSSRLSSTEKFLSAPLPGSPLFLISMGYIQLFSSMSKNITQQQIIFNTFRDYHSQFVINFPEHSLRMSTGQPPPSAA